MTHRGPFQFLPFCDSVILCIGHLEGVVKSRWQKNGVATDRNKRSKKKFYLEIGKRFQTSGEVRSETAKARNLV